MGQVSPDMTPFDVFEARTTRRLAAMRHALAVELNHVHGEVVKLNAQANSRSIFTKLPLVEACADAATEFVLTEAKALTDPHRARAWHMWLEDTAERARSVLNAHVEAIYASDWRMPPEVMHTVRANVDDARKRTLAKVDGEVGDFERGVWQPKPTAGGTTISNNVHIGGNMSGGVIQQAGDHAQQQASVGPDAVAISQALDALAVALASANLGQATTNEIMAEIETVRAQLKKPSPNFDIIRIATGAIGSVCASVGANVLTPHLLLLLAAVGMS